MIPELVKRLNGVRAARWQASKIVDAGGRLVRSGE
jgi:hypothetical protein